jgi:hypothetical protein
VSGSVKLALKFCATPDATAAVGAVLVQTAFCVVNLTLSVLASATPVKGPSVQSAARTQTKASVPAGPRTVNVPAVCVNAALVLQDPYDGQ